MLDEDLPPLLKHVKPKQKSLPIANRILFEYYHIGIPAIQPNTVRLKKWRLCSRLFAYIRLLLQFQRNQIKGLKTPLRRQKNFTFKKSISSVEEDLDFEIETLIIYKEFVLHIMRNPKWITTL